jgi:ATP-binding cassette subfamily B protein/ATP-binding cassette subfamily C protein
VTQIGTLDQDLANLFDYREFMQLPERVGGTKKLTQTPELIELQNISFNYPNAEAKVLDDVTMTIQRKSHIAIVGENGAGKTTLVKILTGLYDPVDGQVLVDGMNLKEIRIRDWHRQLGTLQQHSSPYDFASAKDGVIFGDVDRPYDEERYQNALAGAEAKSFVSKLPKGDQSLVNPWMEDEEGNKGVNLSGGQWQRLALARNFYRDSPIIILDEPTSAIDALAESRIFKRLLKDKSKTIITISHRLTTVEKADVIYMLKDGKIVEQGTHAELIKKRGEYFTMFESQLHQS